MYYKKFLPSVLNIKYRSGQADNIGTFDFTCRGGVTLNPCISATNQDLKNKKVLLAYGLRNIPQKFQPSAINRKYRSCQGEEFVFLILLAQMG